MSGLKRSAVVFLILFTTVAAAQTAQDNLKKARALVGQGKFAPALKLVERAMSEAGNDLETTLELFELQGVCDASLKKAGPAKTAFGKLLSLAPGYTLRRKANALTQRAFADAKAAPEPLTMLPAVPDMSAGKISDVALEVKSDTYKLAKAVVFNYRVSGGKWKFKVVPISGVRVAAKVDAPEKVEWYAMVLGANEAEILRIRDVNSPITHNYRAPTPKQEEAVVVAQDAPRRTEDAQLTPSERSADIEVVDTGGGHKRKAWVIPAGAALIVLGAAAGGVGTYFGVQASGARTKFASATNGEGLVTLISRQQAQGLDGQARSGGLIANTLWVSAGALVLTGIAVLLFGPDEAAQ